MSLFERWRQYLDDLQHQGRRRRLLMPSGVDFSSNDYLAYGKKTWPTLADELSHSGQASRLLRGQHPLWEQVEARLAAWHRAETALMMTSGYAANEGLLSALLEPGDCVLSDQLNHASLIDGIRLGKAERVIFRHNDLNHLEACLRGAGRAKFVVTEALFGMEGDRAPLREMAELSERFGAHLVVDEAHSTGCFGPAGSGLVDDLGLRERVLATVHTGGKALGVCGAYICCSRLLRDVLVNRCRHLIFTTALPPAIATWWLAMLDQVTVDAAARSALIHATTWFRTELGKHAISAQGSDYIVPIILGEDRVAVAAAQTLQQAGFDIRAIRPPTVPTGTARLRISIHADHSEADLRAVAQAIRELSPANGENQSNV